MGKSNSNKTVLIASICYLPNIGGVETHLKDLVDGLAVRNWKVVVLTYQPLNASLMGKWIERKKKIVIYRLPILRGLFYKLVDKPIFEFIYLFPGLFIFFPVVFLHKKPDVVHAHGLVAGAAAVFWKKVFGTRTIISLHSIYNFPVSGIYRKFVQWIFRNCDYCLNLSEQSVREVKSLGVQNVDNFTYWIDMKKFKRIKNAKDNLKWKGRFVILFVGRLVEEKGINELLRAAKMWNKNIVLAIAGAGPLEEKIRNATSLPEDQKFEIQNIVYLGNIKQKDLPNYYSASDLLIVPSTHEEGFGRVILESLACGTPVIGSGRGAIPEAMDESVGKLIDVTPENIKKTVEYYYKHPKKLKVLSDNARLYAEKRYSEKNVEKIISYYLNE